LQLSDESYASLLFTFFDTLLVAYVVKQKMAGVSYFLKQFVHMFLCHLPGAVGRTEAGNKKGF
jgi:hypothetical protein